MSYVYETMYILRADLGEDVTQQNISKYENLLREQGAEEIQIENRGRRKMAYEIKKQRDGVYVIMNYKGSGQMIYVLEKAMRLSDEVIRYLTLKQEVIEENIAVESEETAA